MTFSKEQMQMLKSKVKERLSEKRFLHTLAVKDMAKRLSFFCLPEYTEELTAAALLHDITKEFTKEEEQEAISSFNIELDSEDIKSPGIIHSFTAPFIIKRDFPDFATERILSAVRNHTVGAADMSVFDKIIFLADFIEETRAYEASAQVRSFVLENMGVNLENNVKILNTACIMEIDSTISHLITNKKRINFKNILTRNALLDKI